MKKDLLIIGAGNVGGFIAYNSEHLVGLYNLIGFLDDDPEKKDKIIYGLPVLGTVSDIYKYPSASVIIGIAFPRIKRTIVERLKSLREIDFVSYISPRAWISKGVNLGKGIIIYPNCSINYETAIDDFVTINMNCAIGHNIKLSEYSTLAPNVSLAGFTYLESGVDMGISSCTKQKVRIGENSIVGGNTMLINDIAENRVVVGSPGRVVKIIK